ncbi:DUF3035 domain-containing protein [Alloyangia pacifica]|uniref:Beta-barrel assembly machine subunit BamF n=1 Tax=Alloyangia pacifica TaxID=311180 RepID=A0A1I6RRQ4_9RHOB|nr:DUF3035 domain-containing protein [Alloyangia pacifica]SDG57586.1 Beta-barrel assembly machine subunit BamF [Alloyangia pacifica]SFS67375.1 Beta-barrel assembly machine subunit BamF [Alloyangia pacifica]
MKLPHLALMIGLIGITACTEREKSLHQLRNNRGTPEEFAIVPNKPLEMPQSFAELPAPTPGSANRTDQTPMADAVAALGGNPAQLAVGEVPSRDAALVNRASRYGRDGNIRAQLAVEDAEFRRDRSVFNWKLFKNDEYNRAYREQILDPYAVLNAYRGAGARTPSAPPAAD